MGTRRTSGYSLQHSPYCTSRIVPHQVHATASDQFRRVTAQSQTQGSAQHTTATATRQRSREDEGGGEWTVDRERAHSSPRRVELGVDGGDAAMGCRGRSQPTSSGRQGEAAERRRDELAGRRTAAMGSGQSGTADRTVAARVARETRRDESRWRASGRATGGRRGLSGDRLCVVLCWPSAL